MTKPTAAAEAAAERAGVKVLELTELGDLRALAELLGRLWREPDGSQPVSPHLLRALQLSGSCVLGAFDRERGLVGGSLAWASTYPVAGLHSHITGVDSHRRRVGTGLALKLHQRAWALERGMTRINWTFDPLVRRNAVFNLSRLGAQAVGYIENLYGRMDDALNSGDESDRLLVAWQLESDHARQACGRSPTLVPGDRPLRLSVGPSGAPLRRPRPSRSAEFAIAVPPDIEELRRREPALAKSWRAATRELLESALAEGGRILGMDREANYVVRTNEVAAPAALAVPHKSARP
ncbi:MAG: GNAT family N-acetyltransferase [Acidimicrobiales bacterium]